MTGLLNLVGQTLGGRYRIDKILGKGGMSTVYQAYDPNLRRTVAIKVIHAHLADDPKFITRFQEEAAAVAMLRHPNIVQVYDFNHDDDLYYMVQEFIAGETLQDRLRRLNAAGKRMPIADAVRLTIQMCNAAEYAHQRGMIHRDIKPANIMIDNNGQGILMDFGIVKIVGGERHTSTGVVVGTALYMSPETIHGQAPDPRSDIYSLGVTLFEMFSGKPPFDAESAMAVMMMHLNSPLPPLASLRPEVPEALIVIAEKSLAKRSEARYTRMAEMAADLKAFARRMQSGVPYGATLNLAVDTPPGTPSQPQQPLTGEPTQGESQANGSTSNDATRREAAPSPATPPAPPMMKTNGATYRENQPGGTPAAPESATMVEQQRSQPAARMPSPPQPAVQTTPPWQSGAAGFGSVQAGNTPPSGWPTGAEQPPRPMQPASSKKGMTFSRLIPLVLILALALLLGVGGIGVFALRELTRASTSPTAAAAAALVTTTPAVTTAATQATAAPSATAQPTVLAALEMTEAPPAQVAPTEAAATMPPMEMPAVSPAPAVVDTPTIPEGVPFSLIQGVTLNDQGRYDVEYKTFEFTEKLDGLHLIFYFNTQTLDKGYMYGGPRPFAKFAAAERPKTALSLCVAVANPDHTPRPESGNCVRLPDVVGISAPTDTACLQGPGSDFPQAALLHAGNQTLALGLSSDEAWWNVVSPQNPSGNCWLPVSDTRADGDISKLPLAEVTAEPTPSTFVEITGVTIGPQNRYSIAYQTHGFQEQLPGMHIHFFYNIFTPDQVGITGGGNRLMYGGPSPFTGFRALSRPPQATQICALVANPDHTIIPGSGNCFQLPDAQ